MDLASYRRKLGVSQTELAVAVGLGSESKSYISSLETGARCATIERALKIEAWSNGKVPAASLLSPDDAELLAHHRRLSTAQPAEVAA